MALGDRILHIQNKCSSMTLSSHPCGVLRGTAGFFTTTTCRRFDAHFATDRLRYVVCFPDLSEDEFYIRNTQPMSNDTVASSSRPQQEKLQTPHETCRTQILRALKPRSIARWLIPNLLRVSKEAYIEGTKLLYSTNTFSFNCVELLAWFVSKATVEQRSCIRHLRLSMNFQGHGVHTWGGSFSGNIKKAAPHPGIVVWSRAFLEVIVPQLRNLESLSLSIGLEGM